MPRPRKPSPSVPAPQKFFGKYRGVVVNTQDPLNMARIRASVPSVLGNAVSDWAAPASPYAGQGIGFFALPRVGDVAWIEFEAGDPSLPIWVGGWWGPFQVPLAGPEGAAATPSVKVLRTEAGLVLAFDDEAQTITISDGSTQNQLSVDVRNGILKLKGMTRIVLESPKIQEGSESAAHPAVLGEQLVNYLNALVADFNAHTHVVNSPGAVVSGPPTSPQSFPPADLLSQRVMLE